MTATDDEQKIGTLERKMDEGFAKVDDGFKEMRAEFVSVRNQIVATERNLRGEIEGVRADGRSDFRTLLAVVIAMWVATILSVVAAIVTLS
jgi:hypothetical protein